MASVVVTAHRPRGGLGAGWGSSPTNPHTKGTKQVCTPILLVSLRVPTSRVYRTLPPGVLWPSPPTHPSPPAPTLLVSLRVPTSRPYRTLPPGVYLANSPNSPKSPGACLAGRMTCSWLLGLVGLDPKDHINLATQGLFCVQDQNGRIAHLNPCQHCIDWRIAATLAFNRLVECGAVRHKSSTNAVGSFQIGTQWHLLDARIHL